jgi:CRISPR-associated protein Cmr2
MNVLHFTLGPVQSFVGQARRTRDLWAGSFLLSYLAGHAMKAVIDKEGGIAFPAVQEDNGEATDELLKAITNSSPHDGPKIGSLPNRFKAKVPEGFDPKDCESAVHEAWRGVADAAWHEYVAPAAGYGNETRSIWERQVESFWDMSWVVGKDPGDRSDNAWLDRRKNWRTHQPPPEPGDKCTLMGSWQELSGWLRKEKSGELDENEDRKSKQQVFWERFRDQKGLGELTLGDNERLCAIALIKRLFPNISKTTVGWELYAKSWPSTPYMAAVPWIEEACKQPEASEYLGLIEASEARKWEFGEYNTYLQCLQNAGRLAKLDGNFFHRTALENERATPNIGSEDRRKLLEGLGKLNDAVGRPSSPFYTLLLMDGDSLGELLQNEHLDPKDVSAALARFTEKVDGTVRHYCGKTIYAGGDDVLALLPLDRALESAAALRANYLEAFEETLGDRRPDGDDGEPLATTISAGLIFAHYHTSMRAVLKEAHRLLDKVAKDRNGRDSIAVSVLTGSGRTVEWVSSWDESPGGEVITAVLQELSDALDEQFAGRFFYNVRQRFGELIGENGNELIEGLDAQRPLTAEYLKSREREASIEEAEERVGQLLKVCRERKGGEPPDENTLNVSGALLVRFLATKGRGVER